MTSKDKFFSNKLLEWYEKNQRELPWRKNIRHKDYPYRVLVSEFMLQQTTVATVIPYFKKFIKEWPTLKKLSHAKIEDVLLCLLYTSPSPRDATTSRMPSSA